MSTIALPLKPLLADDGAELYARPYDVLTQQQARQHLANHPDSIIQVTRPDILPEDGAQSMYELAQGALKRLKTNRYQQHPQSCLIRYETSGDQMRQVGVMCLVDTHSIRIHEVTRQDKVDDRIDLSRTLRCQISPIMLFSQDNSPLSEWMQTKLSHTEQPISSPQHHWTTSVLDQDNIHRLTLVDDPELIASFEACCQQQQSLYLADGHHRCAMQMALSNDFPRQHASHILAVVYPAQSLHLLGYHRVVKRPPQLSSGEILGFVDHLFTREVATGPLLPQHKGQFGMRVDNQWYQLTLNAPEQYAHQLDASILQEQIIAPLLGVVELRADPNIAFIGGEDAIDQMEHHIQDDPHNWVGFTLYPTSVDEIVSTSDVGGIMPPKSTYFEPKLLDGLVLQEESQVLSLSHFKAK